jgi:nucleoside-diphosphate-sugar epimerase
MTATTVLVTGAFGQIGRRCNQILLDRGHTVIATDLRTDGTAAVEKKLAVGAQPGRLIPAYIDLRDRQALRELIVIHQPAAIVHLAAIVSPPSYRNPGLARSVNVGGTENLLAAAASLPDAPLFLMASSAAVYGSRNPYRYPERITPDTPVNPIDQYGEDKVLAEAAVRGSGLPYALLRLGGVMSPDAHLDGDYLLLLRATPGDNRMHMVDSRDAALAFANAVDRAASIAGKVLLIGGNESYVKVYRDIEDDIMAAIGLGRLGPSASLPGDPTDDRGWAFTGWFDTTESQALLDFQQHDWGQSVSWLAESQGRMRMVLRILGPVLRPTIRTALKMQRYAERRGPYADPWALIAKKYGPAALAGVG